MILKQKLLLRVFAIAGTLFLFSDCAGKVKSWKIVDRHSLDVKILETNEWINKRNDESPHLNKIIRKELKYFIDKDMRIYDRINPSYEVFKKSIDKVDSLLNTLQDIVSKQPLTSSELVDISVKDKKSNIKSIIKLKSLEIARAKKRYYKSLKNINKGLKKDNKKLIFIDDEVSDYKITLFKIRYKRSQLNQEFERFNKKANMAFFNEQGSFYSKQIRKTSKELEQLNKKLDDFEYFLVNITNIVREEVGSTAYILNKSDKNKKYKIKYEKGLKQYLMNLEEMTRHLNST